MLYNKCLKSAQNQTYAYAAHNHIITEIESRLRFILLSCKKFKRFIDINKCLIFEWYEMHDNDGHKQKAGP